jgi:hypothetical protein
LEWKNSGFKRGSPLEPASGGSEDRAENYSFLVSFMEEKMSQENIEKAKEAKKILEDAEECGREAKEIFEEIGDPDGAKKASSVEREAKEAKEYVERRVGKDHEKNR